MEGAFGVQFVICGVDPGVTTGVCVISWDSQSGKKILQFAGQFGVEDLVSEYESEAGGAVGGLWWDRMHAAGAQLAFKLDDLVEGKVRSGGGCVGVVVMEDYVLSPNRNAGGMGGRDAVVPVALGAVLWGTWKGIQVGDEGCVRRWYISPPAAKKVVNVDALDELKAGGVFRGKPHALDAARHCLLAVRQTKKGMGKRVQ